MIDKKLINKIIKNVLHKEKNVVSVERNIMHPNREWFIGLSIGLLVLSVGAWWNVSTYMEYKEVSVDSGEELAGVVVYRQSLVEKALSDFEVRTSKYETLKKELTVAGGLETGGVDTANENAEEDENEDVEDKDIEDEIVPEEEVNEEADSIMLEDESTTNNSVTVEEGEVEEAPPSEPEEVSPEEEISSSPNSEDNTTESAKPTLSF